MSSLACQGWAALKDFLLDSSLTHEDVMDRLEHVYGEDYEDGYWRPTLNRILETEGDADVEPLLQFIDGRIDHFASMSATSSAVPKSPKKRLPKSLNRRHRYREQPDSETDSPPLPRSRKKIARMIASNQWPASYVPSYARASQTSSAQFTHESPSTADLSKIPSKESQSIDLSSSTLSSSDAPLAIVASLSPTVDETSKFPKKRFSLAQYAARRGAEKLVDTTSLPSAHPIRAPSFTDGPSLTLVKKPDSIELSLSTLPTLTSVKKPDSIELSLSTLRSFDARAAAALPNNGLLITTPNMDFVHAPVPKCETRMRRANNFAKDDPLYWPQPFHLSIAHLSVIPYPSHDSQHPLYYAWYQPASSDFWPNTSPGLRGIGSLDTVVAQRVSNMCDHLFEDLQAPPDVIKNDPFLVQARTRLRKLVERLSVPGSRFHVFLQLSLTQRVFLETYARWKWLEVWAPRYTNVDAKYETERDVIGAFTDNLDTAADLYRVGIPVWLVRPLETRSYTKILKDVAPLDETWDAKLPFRNFLGLLDVADNEPAHPIIYSGLSGSSLRYTKMASFVHEQFATALIGGFTSTNIYAPHFPAPATSVTRTASTAAARARPKDLDFVDVTARDTITLPPVNKKQKFRHAPTSSHPEIQEERNRFLRVEHEFFPRRLTLWDEAQTRLKELHRRSGPSLRESPLLDPALFISPSNTFRTSLFMMWLRLRPLFLWRLSLPIRGKFYTNKEWRKLLDAMDGNQSAKGRAEMLHELKEVVKDSRQFGIDIDDSNIASVPALWKGAPVLVLNNGMPEPDVVQAAVWELYEINFRLELIMLDRELLPEPVGVGEYGQQLRHEWMEREVVLNQCWPGLAFRPDTTCAGLSSCDKYPETITPRIPFLKALHQVVRSWPGAKPPELVKDFPTVEESDLTPIRNFEASLANYYVRTFLKVFHRPAMIPHYMS